MGGEPGSRGVPTGAEALQSVLVVGHLGHRDVHDLSDLEAVDREGLTVVVGHHAEAAVAFRRRTLEVALQVVGGDGTLETPRGVLADDVEVGLDHLGAAHLVGLADARQVFADLDLVLPRAVAGGRLLRGGLGLRRLRGLAVVAVVGHDADDQERDGHDGETRVARVGAQQGDAGGQEAAPPIPEPADDHAEAGEHRGQAVHEVLGLAVDAGAATVGLGAFGDHDGHRVGGGGCGGGQGVGLAHGSAPG